MQSARFIYCFICKVPVLSTALYANYCRPPLPPSILAAVAPSLQTLSMMMRGAIGPRELLELASKTSSLVKLRRLDIEVNRVLRDNGQLSFFPKLPAATWDRCLRSIGQFRQLRVLNLYIVDFDYGNDARDFDWIDALGELDHRENPPSSYLKYA